MRPSVRLTVLSAFLLTLSAPAFAQPADGLMGDLLKDVSEVKTKIVGLAKAMPEGTYGWRPGQGVRSTAETFLHVAADNYFIPAAAGMEPPAESGISSKDYKTTIAFEKRALSRDQVVAELEKSFAFLTQSMGSVSPDSLGATIDVFGQKMTKRALWLATVTHLHEHLGQLIAYARSNNVTPPWSK